MLLLELTQGRQALVDADMSDVVCQFVWYADQIGNTWYAATRIAGRKVYLHRLVMQARATQLVDHIDCNGLNCLRSNLRFLSKSENTMRRGPLKGQYKGVTYEKSRNKWVAKHTDDIRGTVNLGRYKTAEEAARVYDRYVRLEFGELAYVNFSD